jgi:hypothetical protein
VGSDEVKAHLQWIEDTLKGWSEDKDIIWKVTLNHFPLYSVGSHGDNKVFQSTIEDLYKKYGVYINIVGHEHNQEYLYRKLADVTQEEETPRELNFLEKDTCEKSTKIVNSDSTDMTFKLGEEMTIHEFIIGNSS